MRSTEQSGGSVVALCGPSGVGKGHVKELIKHGVGVNFSEPVVCTTRPSRADDGMARRAGLSEGKFAKLVERGDIVLPHQPFREPGSPWYGFDAGSFDTEQPILTEVHSTILKPFRTLFLGRRALTVCLISDDITRVANIMNREAVTDSVDFDRRVHMGGLEIEEINAALHDRYVDAVLDCSLDRRNHAQRMAVEIVKRFIGEQDS